MSAGWCPWGCASSCSSCRIRRAGGLDAATAQPVRACALLAGTWFLFLAWPAAAWGPESGGAPGTGQRLPLAEVWRYALRLGHLRLYLLARVLTIDGVTTLVAFGGIYAAASTVEDRIGAQTTTLAATVALAVFGAAILVVHNHVVFLLLGAARLAALRLPASDGSAPGGA